MAELTDSITDILLSGSTAQKLEPTDIAGAMLRAQAGRSSYGEELNRIRAHKINESQNLMKTMTWLVERQKNDAALKRQADLDRRTQLNATATFTQNALKDWDIAGHPQKEIKLQEAINDLRHRFGDPATGAPIPTNDQLQSALPEIMRARGFSLKDESTIEERKARTAAKVKAETAPAIAGAEETARLGAREAAAPFGTGEGGRVLAMLQKFSPLYESGKLTPDQARQFEAAATEYTQPRWVKDAITGNDIQLPGKALPDFARRAIEKGARTAPGLVAVPSGGQAVSPTQAQTVSPTQASPTAQEPTTQGTFWSLAEGAVGPINKAAEVLRKAPIVGGAMPFGDKQVQSISYIQTTNENLRRALQNSPRFAEGERKSIEDAIDLDPPILSNPGAFKLHMIGVDDALRERQAALYKIAHSSESPKEAKIWALGVLPLLEQYRKTIGVPERITSAEELKSFEASNPPGTEFVWLDKKAGKWQLGNLPGRAK